MKHRYSFLPLLLVVALLIVPPPAWAQDSRNEKLLPSDHLHAEQMTREAMAVALLQSPDGGGYVPPACVQGQEMFGDVPFNSPFCPWIEELARRGITAGCGGGNYCPSSSVPREQMAVFIVRAQFPNVVPAGLTLMGRWGFDDDSDGNGDFGTSISYPVPMPTALLFAYISPTNPAPPECPGTAALPMASPGWLCVYQSNAVQLDFVGSYGSSRFGTSFYFDTGGAGDNYAYGTWASTAPLN